MSDYRSRGRSGLPWLLVAVLSVPALGAGAPESQRLERAKDLIADEQWVRAVDELKAAAADPKETNKDEALFWLAHSYNQTRDAQAAVETIQRLERAFPASRWVKPARSLRIEIAQRLGRSDVLWWTAAPPPPPQPTPPVAVGPAPPAPAPPPRVRGSASRPAHPPIVPDVAPAPPQPPSAMAPPSPRAAAAPALPPPPPPPPPAVWRSEHFMPDTDLRIQAMGSLIHTDAARVIPMLREIALEGDNPGQARRALFVLAQSGRSDARSTVVEVARTGAEPVRIAAVRELGRLGGPAVSNDLLQVYLTGNLRVRYEVVTSLGKRDGTMVLMRIAQTETDRELRDTAIVALGEAGGLDELRILYTRATADSKRPIIVGLFNCQAEEELIRIADRERDPAIRQEVLAKLRLLGTPRARAYIERGKQK